MRKPSLGKSEFRIFSIATVAMLVSAALAVWPAKMGAQSGGNNSEWPTYGADLASTHYRPLDQINAGNFNKLEVAWTFKTDNLGPRPEYRLEGTPLMIGGVLYATAGTRRAVVALDAATGELLWMHSENEGERGEKAPRQAFGTRARLLERRQRLASPLRYAWIPFDRARCENGYARFEALARTALWI